MRHRPEGRRPRLLCFLFRLRFCLVSDRERLTEFVENFSPVFGRSERRHRCRVYLSGLILAGERKSIEPIAGRVGGGNELALQQFVNHSPWDSKELIGELRRDRFNRFRMKSAILILDDSSLPRKGDKSVGVAHQYCGALGKLANYQSIVPLQAAGPRAHFPIS